MEERIVVACLDFTKDSKLFQFAELKNSQIETSRNGYGTELEEIIETLETETIYDNLKLKTFFWDMFIADALVGNFNRHNGNWGFLINEKEEKVEIAPIYDCASCMYPSLSDDDIKNIINDKEEMETRVFVFPNSAIKINNQKINYYNYINSLENKDCNDALKRIFPNINLDKINKIIEETPIISDIRKKFYKNIIKLRYEKILKSAFLKLTIDNNNN